MVQYRDFTYADTDRLNYKNEKEENAQQELEYEQQLKEKFDNGEISEAEYATLSHQTPVPDDPGAAFIPDYAAENEAEIERQLEEEDRLYLMNK